LKATKSFKYHCNECGFSKEEPLANSLNSPIESYENRICLECKDFIIVVTGREVDTEPDSDAPFGPITWENYSEFECLKCETRNNVSINELEQLGCPNCGN
jgi:hypothetical protein